MLCRHQALHYSGVDKAFSMDFYKKGRLMKISHLFIFSTVVLLGCTTYPNKFQIQHVEAIDGERCKLRGMIEGSSLAGQMISGVDVETAKSRALNQAEALRATHVIWTEVESSYEGTVAIGEAYQCKKS